VNNLFDDFVAIWWDFNQWNLAIELHYVETSIFEELWNLGLIEHELRYDSNRRCKAWSPLKVYDNKLVEKLANHSTNRWLLFNRIPTVLSANKFPENSPSNRTSPLSFPKPDSSPKQLPSMKIQESNTHQRRSSFSGVYFWARLADYDNLTTAAITAAERNPTMMFNRQ
jgi:hypothetical protein